jgi:O-acetyl-ADP-ribose deacetylase (regulator of RNase III)/ribosomal protein S18 acetylase RimI-like enzyme
VPDLRITLETAPTQADRDAIVAGLRAHNRRNAPAPGWEPLTLFLRDTGGNLCGGLIAESGWRWLHVYFLWVSEESRRHGYGRALLERAEAEARLRGCLGIHLDTHDFQAPEFYETLGYEVFGMLEDYPPGHRRYFLRKDLAGGKPVRIEACLGDITTLTVDAIVNAANADLAPGGGVCGAIHRAAGPELAAACSLLAPCPAGEARITPGFRLPARYVIHAVGPVWHGGGSGEADLLASAYTSSLALAGEHSLRSIAFPAISTGIYGYPLPAATAVAVRAVRSATALAPSLERVVFACFNEAALDAYRSAGIAVAGDP